MEFKANLEPSLDEKSTDPFSAKPTNAHIIWRDNARTGKKKKFDFEYLQLWAAQFNLSFTKRTRLDPEKVLAPREQYLCVFAEGEQEIEGVSVGNKTVSLEPKATPRTYIEIDENGLARIQGWNHSITYDIIEMIVDGQTITFRTVDGAIKSLNIHNFTSQ